MTPNLVLLVIAGVLVGTGVYLLLDRSLSRVLIGLVLASNGVNVLFLVAGGAAGGPPIVGATPPDSMSDPLPQAMVLTAIVITLGSTAYLLALSYRSFAVNGHDEVPDDVEDAAIRALADADESVGSYDEVDDGRRDAEGSGLGDEEGEPADGTEEELDQAAVGGTSS